MNKARNTRREGKAPRFNIYANLCDGRGTVCVNDAPVLERSVAAQVKAAIAAGASKEPLVVRQ